MACQAVEPGLKVILEWSQNKGWKGSSRSKFQRKIEKHNCRNFCLGFSWISAINVFTVYCSNLIWKFSKKSFVQGQFQATLGPIWLHSNICKIAPLLWQYSTLELYSLIRDLLNFLKCKSAWSNYKVVNFILPLSIAFYNCKYRFTHVNNFTSVCKCNLILTSETSLVKT